jgi:hypothetical protein
MNRFAAFAKKHRLSVRELAAICSRQDSSQPYTGISKSSIHRLLSNKAPYPYLLEVEPLIVTRLREYLRSLGKTATKAAIEVPDQGFLAPVPVGPVQFTEKITVPFGCQVNYMFKDRNGKLLAIHVFET